METRGNFMRTKRDKHSKMCKQKREKTQKNLEKKIL